MAWIDPSAVAQGEVLTSAKWNQDVVANTIALRVPPMCVAYRNTAQSIANSTITYVSFTAADVDTDGGMFSAGSADRITINTTGVYMVSGVASLDTNATGQREIAITHVGSGKPAYQGDWITSTSQVSPTTNLYAQMACSTIVEATAGDYFRMHVWQNTGGPLNLVGNARTCTLAVAWLGQVS